MTLEVWNPEHPHHAVWREYTQSLLDGKPKVVECRDPNDQKWVKTPSPVWSTIIEYRIVRSMLTLTYSVPMPVTEPLEPGQVCWIARPGIEAPCRLTWKNSNLENKWLRAGLIHLAEADAQAMTDAYLAAMTAALEGASSEKKQAILRLQKDEPQEDEDAK